MRILQVNKFGTATSGAENYFLNLTAKLVGMGHDVAAVCMRPAALPDDVRVFEVPDLDFHAAHGVRAQIQAARSVWNAPHAVAAMERAITDFRPDIVHFHNIAHHLSMAVVRT